MLNEPVIGHSADAYAAAAEAAAQSPEFTPPAPAAVAPALAEAQKAASKLLLISSGEGASFRFLWQVPLTDRDGASYLAFLDAGTGMLVSLSQANVSSSPSCWAKNASQYPAIGLPQNDGASLPNRSIWASNESRHDGFTYEGDHMIPGGQIPTIQIFFGTQEEGFACDKDSAKYGMVPLKTSGGTPTFDDYHDPIEVPGKAAGDALWFTYQTMQTFSQLGWYSYNGLGSWANLVVDDLDSNNVGTGAFVIPDFPTIYASTWAVRFGKHGTNWKWSQSCSLDFVAHEWGHGVVESTANFPYPNPTAIGAQLHEGFADVIGHAVERYRQPDGSGPEKRDWLFGEDNKWHLYEGDPWISHPLRRVDCVNSTCAPPYFPEFCCFHRLHNSGDSWAHDRGNMLGVAFKLLAEGGQNPICLWSGKDPGIDCTINVTGQGLDKATRILFRTLTQYAYDSMGWGDLADVAKAAAFDLYSVCPAKNAGAEQMAANKALGAIGYPGSAGYYQCP